MDALQSLYIVKNVSDAPILIGEDKEDPKESVERKINDLKTKEPVLFHYAFSWLWSCRCLFCKFCCKENNGKFQKKVKQLKSYRLARDKLQSEFDLKNIVELLRLSKFLIKVNMKMH